MTEAFFLALLRLVFFCALLGGGGFALRSGHILPALALFAGGGIGAYKALVLISGSAT